MELDLFITTAEKLKIPSSNYMFKSERTGIIYWFMVCHEHYETTILNQFKPGHRRYGELNMARQLHRKLDQNQIHEKIINFMKSLKGITEFLNN